ncbi:MULTISPECIES: thioredoxin domain-containing protein [unclassified Corallococcus]|uniref:thioredoxin domain-containing protein n=1 Tax=unclassified Corallococcus TaxID=2685029 RepID=UPI001A90413B|nr:MULTISPECIES: thioredoxin domain-containing protein [unclassified Corallococcus]MBN9687516.1 thiol reductase thioredoxin [Corallococcus sp. NCSPR001]WAS88662.1 thioredoxin domain-containing protein [Corallococcus sp. NCRR]
MAGVPVELTPEDFEEVTQKPGMCVVDFWAPWCEPCHAFAPVFAEAAARFPDITFARLDAEAHEAVAEPLGIDAYPTLVAFKDGLEVRRVSEALPAESLDRLLNALRAVDVTEEKSRKANRERTEAGQRPSGVPEGATWDDGDGEWSFGPKDAKGRPHGTWRYWRADGTLCNECIMEQGTPHGPFKRFHEDGSVSQEGAFAKGQLHGPRTWTASDRFTTERMHEGGVSERVRRTVMHYDHGTVRQVGHFNAQGQRVVPSTGEPYPTRPAHLPEDAELREDLNQWAKVTLNADGERHGLTRFWDAQGQLLWEAEFEDGRRHGRYWSRAEGIYADFRVHFEEGRAEGDLACGEWSLMDAQRAVVLTRDLGQAMDEEALARSPVFSNLPRSAEGWRELAKEARADRRYREALLATARACATSLDIQPLKQGLEELTLPRTKDSASEVAHGVVEDAGQAWAPMADALMRGGEAATLLRAYAVLLDQTDRPRAALDFLHAAMLLAPERKAYLFTRGLILLNLGVADQVHKDAEHLAEVEPDTARFLATYARVLFPRFDFWAGQEAPRCGYDGLPEKPAQSLEAIQQLVRKYATRLQAMRGALLQRYKPGATVPWLPPDLSGLLGDGPVELKQEALERDEDEQVEVDETLDLEMGFADLTLMLRGDWSALSWLLWSCGETTFKMPTRIAPPADYGQAAGQTSQRLWQSRDRKFRGNASTTKPGQGFLFEGVALGDLHPNLVSIAERQYAETQAMFYWLNDPDNVSPWQSNLRGS